MKRMIASLCMAGLFIFAGTLQAQTKTVVIKGHITGQNGEPLSGVSVTVKGTTEKGTTTTAEGAFQVTALAGSILQLSYVGYISKEIKAGSNGDNNLNVQLLANKNELDQIIVIGYGTRKKSDVTGAITSISEQAIQDVPSANLTQALQGQGAGIDIQKSGGNSKPGQSPNILIRGTRSVKAGNSPLFVIDGIPFSGNIDDINQDDVASVEVLKDASSTAIYGSRGANGVILVTTKRGKSNRKPVISYSSYAGFTKSLGEYPMMNGAQYELLKKWAYYLGNPGVYTGINDPNILTIAFAPEEIKGMAIGRNTDWQKLVYKTGVSTDHQLSVMGGSDNTQYAIGGGYYIESGVYPGQSFERYSLKMSVDQQLGKFVKIGLSTLNTYTTTKGENANPMAQALRASPLASPYDSTGALINGYVPGSANQVWNPLDNFLPGASAETRNRLGTFTTLYLEANLAKGLKFRFNGGAELRSDVYGSFYAKNTTNNLGVTSSAANQNTLTSSYTLENLLIYDKTIAQKHKINFTGLYSFQKYTPQYTSFSYTGLLSDQAQYYNPSLGANFQGTGSLNPWVIISYMGRLNYSFNDKYLLTLTGRSDGSSRLAPGNKYHVFPSAAAAWNIMKEPFFSHVTGISSLRLRASYGSVGNPAIDPFQTLGSLTTQVYNYGSTVTTGLYPNSAPNPTLDWEYTSTANIGLDFGFFQNRLSGSVEVYHSYTKNMIMPVSLPATSGIPNQILTNIGKSENKGIELHLSTVNIQGSGPHGLTWTSDFNIFLNRGEITQLLPSITTTLDGKPADIANKWFVGKPIGSFYDYQKIGIWQANAKDSATAKALGQTVTGTKSVIGQVKIADRNGNGVIDAGDEYVLGSPQPKWEGGTTQRVTYRNFDFTVVAFARMGSTISSTLFGGGFTNTLQANYNNVNVSYWTPNNPTNDWPKANSAQTNPSNNSTLGYFDGSFLKIRSLGLGYTIPADYVKKIGLRSIRVYVTARDPFILFSLYRNKYHGIDPETAGTLGVDTPAYWSMLFGLNVSL
ncbi:MAG TPA: TonB-dependent receptor [Chitinophagaceae bacterium]